MQDDPGDPQPPRQRAGDHVDELHPPVGHHGSALHEHATPDQQIVLALGPAPRVPTPFDGDEGSGQTSADHGQSGDCFDRPTKKGEYDGGRAPHDCGQQAGGDAPDGQERRCERLPVCSQPVVHDIEPTCRSAREVAWDTGRVTRGNKILVVVFAVLAIGSMLLAGVFAYFVRGKDITLVVSLQQTASQADRQSLKDACGSLPGTSVVRDRGDPDPRIQGRFPVRFDITHASFPQQAALEDCINKQGPVVRGFISEGDR